ncbi:MAG TPA: 50S ribosomal protein L11 methyltransferase [Vicinamibacterales bacterium]|nr:50S ribosomal protein L11 methyltransferase [Vicinamibacterales bacterium]
MSLLLDEHREYLSDHPRVDAFRRAIHATVRPGDIVLDLGCGTGILGLMACEAGAARVYAIDEGGMIEIARAIARHNGCGDRITHIAAHSTRAALPERAGVLVFDQIGRLGFDAGLLELAADARRRLLTPDARIVPGPVTLDVALVSSPVMRERVSFWNVRPAGIDTSPAFSTAINTGYPMKDGDGHLLSDVASPMTFDAASWDGGGFSAAFDLTAAGACRADGLCGWFRAKLAPGIWMTNAPGHARRINRRPAFLPFERPLDLAAGERVTVTLRVLPADSILSWDVERAGGGDRMSHSTWKALLPTHDAIARTRAGAVPVLTEHGIARRSVLELCDGRRTVREIEVALAWRHPDLFAEPQSAEVFVAEVLTVYARA